jgi:hypothetical protein
MSFFFGAARAADKYILRGGRWGKRAARKERSDALDARRPPPPLNVEQRGCFDE